MARQEERATEAANRARETDSEVNKTMLARKVLIERRKEEHERAREEAEKEEEQKKRAEQVCSSCRCHTIQRKLSAVALFIRFLLWQKLSTWQVSWEMPSDHCSAGVAVLASLKGYDVVATVGRRTDIVNIVITQHCLRYSLWFCLQAAREAEENARRTEEARKREEDRLTREFEEQEAEEVRKMMLDKGIVVKDGETLDKRALMQREFERKAKEQNEFEAKMNKIARNMDYLERARREEELPFLEDAMKIRAIEQKEYFEVEQVNALVQHKEKWVADVDAKRRSTHLSEDKCDSIAIYLYHTFFWV